MQRSALAWRPVTGPEESKGALGNVTPGSLPRRGDRRGRIEPPAGVAPLGILGGGQDTGCARCCKPPARRSTACQASSAPSSWGFSLARRRRVREPRPLPTSRARLRGGILVPDPSPVSVPMPRRGSGNRPRGVSERRVRPRPERHHETPSEPPRGDIVPAPLPARNSIGGRAPAAHPIAGRKMRRTVSGPPDRWSFGDERRSVATRSGRRSPGRPRR